MRLYLYICIRTRNKIWCTYRYAVLHACSRLNVGFVSFHLYFAQPYELRERTALLGLSPREMVVLSARPRSPAQMGRLGFTNATYASNVTRLSNEYFQVLLGYEWQASESLAGLLEYRAQTQTQTRTRAAAAAQADEGEWEDAADDAYLYMTPLDMALLYDAELQAVAQEYAADKPLFLRDFAAAWTKLVTADRYAGPAGNICASDAHTADRYGPPGHVHVCAGEVSPTLASVARA